jgi:type II secretory pathway pseudopilin PulG
LAELLVVVAIIGLLAALITPALYRVVLRARENRIAQEVSQLHAGIDSYKQKHGDYPPDFSDSSLGTSSVVTRHLRKAFQRHTDDKPAGSSPLDTLLAAKLTPAEAIVFCLSQLCNDPRQPLSSTSQQANSYFQFDQTRLKATRVITLGSRQVQLYTYLPKDGGDTPYVYFDSRTYGTNTAVGGGFTINSETVRPYKRKIEGQYKYGNETTYQIICAGLDAEFGDTAATKAKGFPDGLADAANLIDAYTPADMDNITNFSEGRTLQESRE